ncbi:hypothetical protein C3L33_17424, partial [Rhododendron williamsianum]
MDNRYYLYASEHQAIVNGAVHWVMCSREFDSWVIVYFDLVEEKFKEVPPPSLWNDDDDEMNLVVLRGFLCVYCDIGVRQIEVYAMKEYGKKESWARLFVIPWAIERRVPCSTYLKPLCLTKKGQVLVSVGKRRIGIYDPKDRTFLLYDSVRGRTAIPYVESLVSLNGGCLSLTTLLWYATICADGAEVSYDIPAEAVDATKNEEMVEPWIYESNGSSYLNNLISDN